MNKISPTKSLELTYPFAIDGTTIGFNYPKLVRQIDSRTNVPFPEAEYDLARSEGPNIPILANSIGMDLPPEQDILTYEETEEAENGLFMAYCKQCCPELHDILNA